MKIGFIYGQKTYPPESGGSIHGYQLTKCLTEKGVELDSFYWGDSNNPWLKHYRLRDFFKFLYHIDILYLRAEWRSGPEIFSLLKLLRPFTLPVIWELNGTPSEVLYVGRDKDYIKRIESRLRRLGKFVDAAICVTEGISQYAMNTLEIKNAKCIPNGSDPDLFFPVTHNCPDSRRPLRVAWVGTTAVKWQDMDTFIQAAHKLEGKNIEFCIYGDPKHLPDNLPKNIELKGLVPYKKLGAELAQADVGVQLFRNDLSSDLIHSSPLKLFDYMACGLAIITQANGQRKEILLQCNSGLETTGTLDDFCTTLIKLEQDRHLCAQLGNNGRKAVENYFNWDRVADETIALCSNLIIKRKNLFTFFKSVRAKKQ